MLTEGGSVSGGRGLVSGGRGLGSRCRGVLTEGGESDTALLQVLALLGVVQDLQNISSKASVKQQ